MELSDEERYAVASLFTMALHATQHDGGNGTEEPWGEPAAVERDSRLVGGLSDADLEGWWGYDLVAPGGLLDRIYCELQVAATKWRGLKLLPAAAPSASGERFRQMVRGLIDMLDPQLAAALPPLLQPRRSLSQRLGRGDGGAAAADAGGEGEGKDGDDAAGLWCEGGVESPLGSPEGDGGGAAGRRRDVRDDLFDGLINSDSESDEDWAADVEREKKLLASVERKKMHSPARRLSLEAEELLQLSAHINGLSLQPEAGAAGVEEQQQGGGWDQGQQAQQQEPEQQQQQQQHEEEQREPAVQHPLADSGCEDGAALGGQPGMPLPPQRPCSTEVQASPKAIGAVWELVQCCVGAVPLPPAQARGLPRLPRPLAVRWYDARARVALLQVASWLQVPARKVSNLELLLTQDKAPHHKSLSSVEEDAWTRRMRYLKVGAAAVGGGALFAVTGGLAAPAIAAGMGSILGFIGAPTAIAGTVTGFLASTAGAATVTTTMAASGAASTGSKMAYRVAEISEFGFLELLPQQQQQQQQPATPVHESHQQQQAQQQQGEEKQQDLRPPASLDQQLLADLGGALAASAAAAAADPDAGSDPGHLQAGGGYRSARAQALARASSAASGVSSASSSSGGGLARLSGTSGSQQQQQQAQQALPECGVQQQSVWQRWFSSGSSKKEEEALLLPVPMRVKQSGDVKLSVTIHVAGWITQKSDFESTWKECIMPGDSDCFTLVWETKVLLHLNSALGRLLTTQAASQSLQLATHSFFYAGAGLVAALGPTVLLGTASGLIISNAWAVASERAVKAGKLLAHLLLSGAHGDRPVKLVAHGMGARLVFHCLLELCRQGARGVVQHAVLMGCPVGTEAVRWRMARRAVAGRLVNCYTRKDMLLGVMAGGSSGWMKATAGLMPIEGVAGVENANLTQLITGHFTYMEELPAILDMLMM